MNRIVVVGNGIAGLTACDALRSAGFDGTLTVVGAEHHQPYSRPALSKALLHDDGEGTPAAHLLPAPAHGADELLGVSAAGLDVERRMVRLEGGAELAYDGLVIATGSRAKRLADGPGSGIEPASAAEPKEFTLRTLEDATALRQRIAERPSVVVLGGGPLGMEVASGALQAGCEVTLISDAQPLARQLGGYLSDVFTAAARKHGLRLISGSRARLIGSGPTTRVILDDGTELAAELIVSAVGDVPNTEWLADSGLLGDGVLRVDTRGRVRPEIVAAGDVANLPTTLGGGRIPLWTSAIEQAKVAALGLLHGDAAPELDFQQYFWTEAFGLSLKSVGTMPVAGPPHRGEPGKGDDSMLLRWENADGTGTAAALNYRIPIPKLRRLAGSGPAALVAV